MSSVLGDLLRFYGVDHPELLDALDWKYRRIDNERNKFREALTRIATEMVTDNEARAIAEAALAKTAVAPDGTPDTPGVPGE